MKIDQANFGNNYIKSAIGQQRTENAASIHAPQPKNAIGKIAKNPAL